VKINTVFYVNLFGVNRFQENFQEEKNSDSDNVLILNIHNTRKKSTVQQQYDVLVNAWILFMLFDSGPYFSDGPVLCIT
jgi:hypothetical protein